MRPQSEGGDTPQPTVTPQCGQTVMGEPRDLGVRVQLRRDTGRLPGGRYDLSPGLKAESEFIREGITTMALRQP